MCSWWRISWTPATPCPSWWPELKGRHPASLKLCVLLDKPERRTRPLEADYVGFTIPDAFVVGCGLDYDQKYRQLPYIGVLKPSVYE